MPFLCAITCHYMSLRVHYVIYNRLNSVYIETDSQVRIFNELVQSTPETIPQEIHDL